MLDGNPIVLSLPQLSDTMANVVSKTATALSTLATGLTPKVTPSQLDVNSALSMAGNALTNVGSVQLAAGNVPTVAGSFYYSAGEFYLVDSAGAVQVTSNGVLNVAGQVGIVGDYGGSNPARVTYVDSSGQFIFTEDTSVYADLVADDLILEGTNGSVTFGVDSGLTGGKSILVKSLNAANTSLLCYKAASSTLEDSATNTDDKQITGNVVVTSGGLTTTGAITSAGGNVKGQNLLHTATKQGPFPLNGGGFTNVTISINQVTATGASWSWTSGAAIQLVTNDIVQGFFLNWKGVSGQTYTFNLYKYDSGGNLSTLDTSTQVGTGAAASYSRTVTPYTMTAGDTVYLSVAAPAGSAVGDFIKVGCRLTWTHPA
jgi:hypothetical protein